MTIAISLVVGDGIVLGTDSATSIVLPGERYHNIYLNAEKTINLVKGLPVGLMTYGLGSLGPLSIASLARVLRDELSGEAASPTLPQLDRTSYTVGRTMTPDNRNPADHRSTGARRTETPPPPKLSKSQIQKVERWVHKNAPEQGRGNFCRKG